MIVDISYGIVPLKKKGPSYQVLLIKHVHGQYWGIPKGHLIIGEEPIEAATRELKEETNLEVKSVLSHIPVITETYKFRAKGDVIIKTVYYFCALVDGEVNLEEEEVCDAKWLSLDKALKLASFDTIRNTLKKTKKALDAKH